MMLNRKILEVNVEFFKQAMFDYQRPKFHMNIPGFIVPCLAFPNDISLHVLIKTRFLMVKSSFLKIY